MIKFHPITHNVEKLLPRLEEVFQKEKDVVVVYLFGSYATGTVTPLSDVDVIGSYGSGSGRENLDIDERIIN